MGSRGRRSSAELTVISSQGIEAMRRPDPPAELSDEQAEEWRSIVNSLPADWFLRGGLPTLSQYCREIVAGRRVAQLIKRHESGDELSVREYCALLRQQNNQSNIIQALARSMRLTPRSIRGEWQVKKPKPIRKPWADE